MKYAPLVNRIAGDGARAWDIHTLAQQRLERGEDVIVLSVGDPDFDTPGAIVDVAIDSLRRGRHHYTASLGLDELREAIAGNHQRDTGQPVSGANVAILAGAQNAMMATALCVLGPGDEVIVPEPRYVTYDGLVGTCGATLVPVALDPEDGFQLDPARIEAAISPATRAVLVNTPHNPTGSVLRRDVLIELAAICQRHDLWMISDEVYATITYGVPHISPSAMPGMADRSVTISSLSKSHAMTGWRLGWVIGPTALVEHIENLSNAMLYGSPPFIQDAALFALTHHHGELDDMKKSYEARRDLVCTALDAIDGVRAVWPEGGMFVMADIRATGMTSQDFVEQFYHSEGVSLLSGEAFGPSGAGHVRISLTAADATLAECCRRIARFVTKNLPV